MFVSTLRSGPGPQGDPTVTAPQPYSGIRILDLTFKLGRYATKLFADLGAEVIRIEPQAGLPDRIASSGADYAFAFFNTSKKSIVLDLDSEAGRRAFVPLAESAAVIFLEAGGPLSGDLVWLRSLNPNAVITHIAPYGLCGPLEHVPATDLTLQAAGGIAWLSGRTDAPPLRLPVDQSVMIASVYAAVATAICLMDTEAGGGGHLVDVSAQEAIAHSLQNALQVFDLEGRISRRGGEGTRDATEDIFPCKDGYVFLAAPIVLGISWKALLGWMQDTGSPAAEILSAPAWSDSKWRTTLEAKDAFRAAFEPFLADKTKREATEQALRRKIVMSAVSRISDVLQDEQLAYRDYFVTVADPRLGETTLPGAPYRLSAPVWRAAAAPSLGQHDADLLAAAPTRLRQA